MMTSRSKSLGRSASGHRRPHARRMTSEEWWSHLESYMYISKQTEMFNSFIYTLGRRHARFLQLWYTCGVGFGLFAMVAGVLVLAWEATRFISTFFFTDATSEASGPLIAAVIPGVNVPLTDVGYLAISLVIAIGIHEFGHGIAAASEGVAIEHLEVFLAFVLFPGALVVIKRETLQLLSSFRTLRILCAGIWHNAVCCAGCWLLLLLLPFFLYPSYSHGNGAVVLSVSSGSPVAGHISPGDMISHINDQKILNSRDWFLELNRMHKNLPPMGGLCVPTSDIKSSLTMQEKQGKEVMHGTVKALSKQGLRTHLTQQNFTSKSLLWEVQWNQTDQSNCPDGQYFFREVRCTVAQNEVQLDERKDVNGLCLDKQVLIRNPKCGRPTVASSISDNCSCNKGEQCLQPELNTGEAFLTLTFVRSKHCTDKPVKPLDSRGVSTSSLAADTSRPCVDHFSFVGEPEMLAEELAIVNYRPRTVATIASISVSAPLWLPYMLVKLVTYILQYSAGIAVANSIPVFYLDGQAILKTLLSILVPYMRPSRRRRLHLSLSIGGTVLLLLAVVAGFWAMLFDS